MVPLLPAEGRCQKVKFGGCSTHISVFKISLNLQLWSGTVTDVSLDSAGCLDAEL